MLQYQNRVQPRTTEHSKQISQASVACATHGRRTNQDSNNMSNEIAIIKRENVELIVSSVPTAYNENQVSHQRCIDAGNRLIDTIHQQGMDDQLDQQAALYIEKARKTVSKMYDKRSPVTKLFDEIRRQFTTMENDVDPSKKDSVPCQLQKLRNEYAAKKRAEEERRRRAAIIEQQKQASIAKYRTDVEEDYRRVFNGVLNTALNSLTALNKKITLDNFDDMEKQIYAFSSELPEENFSASRSMVILPTNVPSEELEKIRQQVLGKLLPKFREQFDSDIIDRKLELSAFLPSKKQELERADRASAEEAERIRREMQEREAAEAAARERERQEREAKEAAAAQMKQQQNEMAALFDGASASVQTCQPKISVKKKISVLNPEGFLPVLMMWWQEEGCTLSVEELTKTFKKQLTFCEKLANAKEGARFIEDESVIYEDEVNAK